MFVISCGFARTSGWPPHDQTFVIKWNCLIFALGYRRSIKMTNEVSLPTKSFSIGF